MEKPVTVVTVLALLTWVLGIPQGRALLIVVTKGFQHPSGLTLASEPDIVTSHENGFFL